jgi:hypothetical protein
MNVRGTRLVFLVFLFFLKFLFVFGNCPQQNVKLVKLEFTQLNGNFFEIKGTFETQPGNNGYSVLLEFKVDNTPYRVCIVRTNPVGNITIVLTPPGGITIPGLTNSNQINNVGVSWSTNSGASCPSPGNTFPQCSTPGTSLIIPPLPVIWHNFSAKLSPGGKSTELNWSTLKEWESSHFEIERSINGIASYEKIGEEQSAGWSDTEVNYSFLDKNLPAEGYRLYYRIKQVDFDGTYDYSPTQMVEIPRIGLRTGWQAYPNPTQGQNLHIRSTFFIRKRENPIIIKMYSLDSSQCITFESFESEIDLSSYLQKFPKGLLIIEILSDQTLEILKVIHQ